MGENYDPNPEATEEIIKVNHIKIKHFCLEKKKNHHEPSKDKLTGKKYGKRKRNRIRRKEIQTIYILNNENQNYPGQAILK